MDKSSDHHVLHSLNPKHIMQIIPIPVFVGMVVASLVLGGGTGFAISQMRGTADSPNNSLQNKSETDASGAKKSAGIQDEKVFKDTAEGTLKEGGFEGEGSFHLERPGGISQNVYMTSTTVDLSEFMGKKVKVWGQTFKASKAGWLMDVGYIEVL